MILSDYIVLLTELGPGSMSEKQMQQIANSSITEYIFDESDMPEKLFERKNQDGYIEIAVDINDKMMSFYTPIEDYRIDIYLNNYNDKGHEILFSKKLDTTGLKGIPPEIQTELYSAIKACVGYFIIYKKFKKTNFHFKASTKDSDAYKDFWTENKEVPNNVRKDMDKFQTLYPAIYKKYEKLLRKVEIAKKIRIKAYTNAVKAVGATLLDTVEEKDYVYAKFILPESFYTNIKSYYESI